MPKASPVPGSKLLSPADHLLLLVDHQSQMGFATKSIDMTELRNNTALVAKSAKGFGVPTIVTTVAEKSFSGPVFPEIRELYPDEQFIDRTTMNAWEDGHVTDRINAIGRTRIVIAGLWTSVCIVGPVLSALEQGFEMLVITDASGDITTEAHERAVTRMVQAGAQPITSLQYLLELQRDWARGATYSLTTGIAVQNGGAYGIGIQYARSMFNASEAA
ncbi:MAG: hydrolase [Steroidobacteraceae bacterium]